MARVVGAMAAESLRSTLLYRKEERGFLFLPCLRMLFMRKMNDLWENMNEASLSTS